ncbi:MAG: hypothetical protein M3464_09690 [Chloroflexota bacterium]|nr:hypothetical protein [Pseudomonadota bacterium]MDQ3693887.1 hypothetical protein [Chloroflexota bacterium]
MEKPRRNQDKSDNKVQSRSGTSPTLTQSDKVLIAFHHVANGSTSKVPYEELVLQAWRDYPEAFSLRNHPEYPDASDIHKKIYQSLKPSGFVVSLGNKVFRLTDAGIEKASKLLEKEDSGDDQERARLSRNEQTFINNALRSRVLSAWRDQPERLVDYDARVFFQFSTGTVFEDRKHRVEFALDTIRKARELRIGGSDELAALAEFLDNQFGHLFRRSESHGQ